MIILSVWGYMPKLTCNQYDTNNLFSKTGHSQDDFNHFYDNGKET